MTERIRNAFDSIHAEEELKERTKDFLYNQTRGRRSRHSLHVRLAAAAVCVAMMLGAAGWVYVTPVSAISLDINPSIELGINRFDRVVSVETYGDDGILPAKELAVKNMNYADAIDQILSNEKIAQLLEQNEQMEVTVVCESEKQRSRMLTRVEDCTADAENISCHAGSSHEAEEAHHVGLSVGKYRAYQELLALDPYVSVEEVQALSMRELRELIRDLSGGAGNGNGGNGAGNGNGGNGAGAGNGHSGVQESDCDDWSGNGSGHGHGGGHGNGHNSRH